MGQEIILHYQILFLTQHRQNPTLNSNVSDTPEHTIPRMLSNRPIRNNTLFVEDSDKLSQRPLFRGDKSLQQPRYIQTDNSRSLFISYYLTLCSQQHPWKLKDINSLYVVGFVSPFLWVRIAGQQNALQQTKSIITFTSAYTIHLDTSWWLKGHNSVNLITSAAI